MSDVTATANRIIPITVELYDFSVTEFPDLNIVGKDDSEYKLLFTCQNKDATSPFTVGDSDLSTTDKQEIVFTRPSEGGTIIRKATFEGTGSDGELFYICQLNDMNTVGTWLVRPRMTEGDVEINWPNTRIIVQ